MQFATGPMINQQDFGDMVITAKPDIEKYCGICGGKIIQTGSTNICSKCRASF